MGEITIFAKLKKEPKEVFEVLREEIGMKTNCGPFATKLIRAMKTLYIRTEDEALDAANTLLSGLQTLYQGGIQPEDYDKIDFVKRGKTIVPSARVEAFLRAAARKGYRIFDTIIAVPREDRDTTYFRENFANGDIVYTLEDKRNNSDRGISAKRLIDKYFAKFLCRLDIQDAKNGKRITMIMCEMSIDEMLMVSMTSEQGIYKSNWETYTDNYGREKKKKVFSNELNSGTFWVNWTGEMVKKTIIRRALKRVKEVLPDLGETIYAFSQDEYIEEENNIVVPEKPEIKIPMKEEKKPRRDLNNPTDEERDKADEYCDIWSEIPKDAQNEVMAIKGMFDSGKTVDEVLEEKYIELLALKRSNYWKWLGGYFGEEG